MKSTHSFKTLVRSLEIDILQVAKVREKKQQQQDEAHIRFRTLVLIYLSKNKNISIAAKTSKLPNFTEFASVMLAKFVLP